MPEQITLYSAKICPFAHRVELALKESKLPYTRFEVDLQNKPEWYAPKVNPASKVPAIAYGGPQVPPNEPSLDSQKLTESLVLVEFVADLSNSLRPADPVLSAKARFFIDAVATKLVPAHSGLLIRGEDPKALYDALEAIQALLPERGYAIGEEWSTADAAVTPFLARLWVALKNDLGAYKEGVGKEVFNVLSTDPKFERIREYFKAVTERESFKATFDENYIVEYYSRRFAPLRAQVQAAKA
ncbi:hypothetical protein AX16_010438 [Volvariella volvacea WC 439]|nr:hypothetical protein AX16_010438 [Volvariella volvacea WC 439]